MNHDQIETAVKFRLYEAGFNPLSSELQPILNSICNLVLEAYTFGRSEITNSVRALNEEELKKRLDYIYEDKKDHHRWSYEKGYRDAEERLLGKLR